MTGQDKLYAEASGSFRQPLVGDWRREKIFALTAAKVLNARIPGISHQCASGLERKLWPIIATGSCNQSPQLRRQCSAAADCRGGAIFSGRGFMARGQGQRQRRDISQAYTKRAGLYRISSLMLANMIDTLGEQFVWLPLKTEAESGGRS